MKQGTFVTIVIVITLVIAAAIYMFVLGNPAIFKPGDVEKHQPINLLGTIYTGGIIVPILIMLTLMNLTIVFERIFSLKKAQGKGSLTAFLKKVQAQPSAKPAKKEIDDLVALYLVAPRGEQIKGEQILSSSYAVQLEFGDKNIFHRKDSHGNVMFSMASMQEPGYFDIDNMHHLKTRGITLFTQLSFCRQPVQALDEMLVCAHSLASMLGVQVCNADRKLLDEAYTLGLRAKARQFAE